MLLFLKVADVLQLLVVYLWAVVVVARTYPPKKNPATTNKPKNPKINNNKNKK